MVRAVLGVVAAATAMFVWGFLYWGATTLPYSVWDAAADEDAAGAALREHFPRRGTFYLPSLGGDAEQLDRRFRAGPLAFVHMLDVDGRPFFDARIMLQGFLLNLAIAALLTALLRQAGTGLPSYGSRWLHAALVGVAAVVLVDFGDAVWWQIPWPWKLVQAGYGLTVSCVAGAVLAAFTQSAAHGARS